MLKKYSRSYMKGSGDPFEKYLYSISIPASIDGKMIGTHVQSASPPHSEHKCTHTSECPAGREGGGGGD